MKKLLKTPKWVDEFKNFIGKSGMLQMAIGLMIGSSFTNLVKNLTENIINPVLGMLLGGGVDLSHLKITLPYLFHEAPVGEDGVAIVNTLAYGSFIGEVINFLLMALVVFLMVKGVNKLTELGKKKEEEEKPVEAPALDPAPSNEEVLLAEIRDLLKKQAESNSKSK